jgi:hypothetical protein
MHQYIVGALYDMIAIGIAGHLSESDRDSQYFLVIICRFT